MNFRQTFFLSLIRLGCPYWRKQSHPECVALPSQAFESWKIRYMRCFSIVTYSLKLSIIGKWEEGKTVCLARGFTKYQGLDNAEINNHKVDIYLTMPWKKSSLEWKTLHTILHSHNQRRLWQNFIIQSKNYFIGIKKSFSMSSDTKQFKTK
jgi:hypothetical protein